MEEKIFMVLQEIQSKMDFMDNEMRNIKTQLQGHGEVLKELEYTMTVSSAKLDAIEYDAAHIRSDLEELKDELCLRNQVAVKGSENKVQLKAVK